MTLLDQSSLDYARSALDLARAHERTQYHFLDVDAYVRVAIRDPIEVQRIYWYEIVERAHLAGVTALARACRWIEAVESGFERKNLLATAAALRGLLEAAADTTHGLLPVPSTLASRSKEIENALTRVPQAHLIATELEERLIHFTHARHLEKREDAPQSHRKLTATEYNAVLISAEIPKIKELYAVLCQIVHPAAHSLLYMVGAADDDWDFTVARPLEFRLDRDEEVLGWLSRQFGQALKELPEFALNPAVLTLAILNHLSVPEFHTPALQSWPLHQITAWKRCRELLEQAGTQVM